MHGTLNFQDSESQPGALASHPVSGVSLTIRLTAATGSKADEKKADDSGLVLSLLTTLVAKSRSSRYAAEERM